jgi:hypothetical protein
LVNVIRAAGVGVALTNVGYPSAGAPTDGLLVFVRDARPHALENALRAASLDFSRHEDPALPENGARLFVGRRPSD